jgi:hypothetical protein
MVELHARINNAVAFVTSQALENTAWNWVPFGRSASYRWQSHWDVLNLICCSFKYIKPIQVYLEYFVFCIWNIVINCGHPELYIKKWTGLKWFRLIPADKVVTLGFGTTR